MPGPILGARAMHSPGRVAVRRLKAVLLLVFGAWLLSGLARGQGMDASDWPSGAQQSVFVVDPKGPVVERLQREIVAGLKPPEVRDRLAGEGGRIIGSTPEQLTQYIRQEASRWQRLVRQADIRLYGN